MPARGAQRSFIPQGEGREPHGQPRAPLVSSRRPLEPRPLLSVGEHGWAGPAPCTAPTEPGHEASQRRSAPQGEGFEPGSRLAQQRDGEATPSLATATSSVTSGQQLDRCRSCGGAGASPGFALREHVPARPGRARPWLPPRSQGLCRCDLTGGQGPLERPWHPRRASGGSGRAGCHEALRQSEERRHRPGPRPAARPRPCYRIPPRPDAWEG